MYGVIQARYLTSDEMRAEETTMRLQKATGKARCQYCNVIIEKDTLEFVAPIASKFDRHHHFSPTTVDRGDGVMKHCPGWIGRNWSFVKDLLHTLTDPLGTDWDDAISDMIRYLEEAGYGAED